MTADDVGWLLTDHIRLLAGRRGVPVDDLTGRVHGVACPYRCVALMPP